MSIRNLKTAKNMKTAVLLSVLLSLSLSSMLAMAYSSLDDVQDKISTDYALGPTINLSNSTIMHSAMPSIIEHGGSLYVAWNEGTTINSSNNEYPKVLMRISNDKGNTFGNTINLSEQKGFAVSPVLFSPIDDEKMYLSWNSVASNVIADEPAENNIPANNSTMQNSYSYYGCNENPFDGIINLYNKVTKFSDKMRLSFSGSHVYYLQDEPIVNNTTSELIFDKSDDYGNTFSGITKITNYQKTHTEPTGYPSVVDYTIASQDSHVYILWSDYNFDFQKRLLLITSDDYGETFGEPIIIWTVDANSSGSFDDIEMISAKDSLHVIWRSDDPATRGYGIYTRTVSGNTIGDPVTISNPSRLSDDPAVTVSGGNVYAAWQDHSEFPEPTVFFSKSTDGGKTFGSILKLNDKKAESRMINVAASPPHVYVVWREQEPPEYVGQIKLVMSSNNGATFGEPINISESHVYADYPQVIASKNKAYVVWTDLGPHSRDIFFRMIQNNSQETVLDESTRYSQNTVSPLKQFKSGIPFSEIKCTVNLQLTQRHDGTPACVKDGTVFELIKRGWTSDMIRLVQSRDVFLDPKDATSSHMNKITPTIDDFKNMLSEPYDIDVIFSKFGKPHDDIGSGIHIYVYELNDFTEIWVGYVDDIWYVKHVDANGNVLEELFVKNEN